MVPAGSLFSSSEAAGLAAVMSAGFCRTGGVFADSDERHQEPLPSAVSTATYEVNKER